jgi:hypothetical protein
MFQVEEKSAMLAATYKTGPRKNRLGVLVNHLAQYYIILIYLRYACHQKVRLFIVNSRVGETR